MNGTYSTEIESELHGEPVIQEVIVHYTFTPGIDSHDPQVYEADELDIEAIKVQFADSRWSVVEPEYVEAIADQFREKLIQHCRDVLDNEKAQIAIDSYEAYQEYRRYA